MNFQQFNKKAQNFGKKASNLIFNNKPNPAPTTTPASNWSFGNLFKSVNSIKNYNKNSSTSSSYFKNTIATLTPTTWVLWVILYLIIGFLVSYLTVMTTKYISSKCLDKKPWIEYISKFCYNDVCKIPYKPVTTNIHYLPTRPNDNNNISSILKNDFNSIKKDLHLGGNKSTQNKESNNTRGQNGGKGGDMAVSFDVNDLDKPPQVFHISNQDFTFEQAKCKCESYKAKLATYAQIVDAYNKGADWCSYGWSEGQAAYYPTQRCNWEKKSEEERKKCGKPGINGGFFPDPYLKFGVNCYGKKPDGKVIKIKDQECKTNYCELPANKFANNRLPTDQIAPFNDEIWSQKTN